jgi:hypothetical protein
MLEVFTVSRAFSTLGRAMAGFLPHVACSEPGPWQASHPTEISDHVVWNVSIAGS